MTEAASPDDSAENVNPAGDASGAASSDPEVLEPPCLNIDAMVVEVDWAPYVDHLAKWRQGHLVVDVPVLWVAAAGVDPFTGVDHGGEELAPVFDPAGRPWVITTQTCDIGGTPPGDRHPFIHVAPLVHARALDKNRVRLGLDRKAGDLVPVLSPFGDGSEKPEWFADLRLQVPLSKAALLDQEPIEGFATEDEYLEFGVMLGYKQFRPALDATLSEDVPRLLDQYVKDNGARKQCFAKVEQVRVLVTPQRLEPTAVTFYIITNGVELTADEREVWERFQAKVSTALKVRKIIVSASVHCDVGKMSALAYRASVPVYSEQLNALRYL